MLRPNRRRCYTFLPFCICQYLNCSLCFTMCDLQIGVDLLPTTAPEVSTDEVGVGEFQALAQSPNESPNCDFENLQLTKKRQRKPSAKMVNNKVGFHAIRQRHVILQTSECQRCYMFSKLNRKVSCHRWMRQILMAQTLAATVKPRLRSQNPRLRNPRRPRKRKRGKSQSHLKQ